MRPDPPVTVSVEDHTATLCVDSETCRLEDLVQAAEDLGYAATVRSIEPRTPAATPGVITGN